MEGINVLVVEDEALLALELCESIEKHGFHVVDYATNSKMCKEILDNHSVDLILMDINLNEKQDGIDLYTSLKHDIPVIYLTAYKDAQTIQKAIVTNPIAYITKPYKSEELYASLLIAQSKIQTDTQKQTTQEEIVSKILQFDQEYSFDMEIEKLYFNDIHIHLPKKETNLLKLLIKNEGNIVFYEVIENEIYTNEQISSNALRTLVYRLRNKLQQKFIENIYGEGIKFKRVL